MSEIDVVTDAQLAMGTWRKRGVGIYKTRLFNTRLGALRAFLVFHSDGYWWGGVESEGEQVGNVYCRDPFDSASKLRTNQLGDDLDSAKCYLEAALVATLQGDDGYPFQLRMLKDWGGLRNSVAA